MRIGFFIVILGGIGTLFPANLQAKLSVKIPELQPEVSQNKELPDYVKNLVRLRRDIIRSPYNYKNYGLLAGVYDFVQDYASELEALQMQVRYMPEDAPDKDRVYSNLARAYLLNQQPQNAKVWLDKAQALNADDVFTQWLFFTYHILQEEYTMAARVLKQLDESKDTETEDFYYNAYEFCLEAIDDADTIIRLFRAGVKENPQSAYAHRALGIAIRNSTTDVATYKENIPEVMGEFKKALSLDPDYVPTYISAGNTYVLLTAWTQDPSYAEQALVWFDKASAIEPDNQRLAFAYGNLYYHANDYQKAIEKLEFAYEQGLKGGVLKETLAFAYNNRAYEIYQSGENLQQGMKMIRKAESLVPNNGIIIGTKAELLYKLGRYEQAHEYIQQALKLEPGHKEMLQDKIMIEKALDKAKEPAP
jgi:tetratricopeptide (TPR) repeat protein